MPTTSRNALRYPNGSDSANVAQYFANLATDVDAKLRSPALIFRANSWTAASYNATNNYNLASLTINPGVGAYIVQCHAAGVFVVAAGTSGSLRLNINTTGIVAADRITATKDSAQATRYFDVPAGGSITLTANLEVLGGSIGTFQDVSNSYLEAIVIPR